jgi:hypothetical protein
LEANRETRRENRISGCLAGNSTETVVYLSSGVKQSVGNFGRFLSIGLLIIDNTKGTQTDVRNRPVAGFSLRFKQRTRHIEY